MSTRNIKDAKDLNSGELIYFKGHAKATYMSDGTTVEDAINNIEIGSGGGTITESEIAAMGFTKNTGTYSKPSTGIPKTDLENDVQTSLGKADTALQSYTEQYKGTITGVSANGTSVATSGVANIPAASTSKYGVTKLSSSTSSTSTSLAATASAVKSAYDLANGRQEKLVSGTNIKTINGESILGSGNISISGGSSGESKEIVVRDQLDGTGIQFNSNYTAFEPNKIYIYTPTLIDSDVTINSVTPPTGDYGEYSLIFSSAEPAMLYISTPANWYWAKGSSPDEVIDIYTNSDLTHYELSVTASKVDNSFVYRAVLTSFDRKPSLDTNPT